MAVVIYFDRDLRGGDHPALACAIMTAAALDQPLHAITHFAPEVGSSLQRQAHAAAIHELQQACAGRVVVNHSSPLALLTDAAHALGQEHTPTYVFASRQHTPAAARQQQELGHELAKHGAELFLVGDNYATSPGTIRTQDGGNYRVFTPFSRRWFEHGWPLPLGTGITAGDAHLDALEPSLAALLPPPIQQQLRARRIGQSHYATGVDEHGHADTQIRVPLALTTALAGLANIEITRHLPDVQAPWTTRVGMASALTQWHQFCDERLRGYATQRDQLAINGTSRMSIQLAYGTIHPRTLLHDLTQIRDQLLEKTGDLASDPDTHALGQDIQRYATELAWREFYADYLAANPHTGWQDANPAFAHMQWDSDRERFAAWCEGRTGVPVVDAAMRQLREIGWMHNRARMIVASFLTKDLHLPWQWGARYFLEHLVDADFASNQHGWQWCAGTGTDAAPFFRIFNPYLQGQKFDPQGAYLQRWVPQYLGDDAPAKGVKARTAWAKKRHQGKDLSAAAPAPIVDHALERAEALRRYQER